MVDIKKFFLDELEEGDVVFNPLIKDNFIHIQIMNETLSLSGEKLNMLEDERNNEFFFKKNVSFYVYSFAELLNSCYFQINAFLLRFLTLLKDNEDRFKIVLNDNLRDKISMLAGTYTSKSQQNFGNKIQNLIEIFNNILTENNFSELKFDENFINKLRIIEILIRNNMSHGYDAIVQDLIVFKRRNGNKILFHEGSILLYENIEGENLNIIKEQIYTEKEDNKKKSTIISKNYVDFFKNISNKNVNHIFESNDFFILSEDLARVYLKRKHILSVYSHAKIKREEAKIEMSKLPENEKEIFPLFIQSDFLIDIKFIDEVIHLFHEKRVVFHKLGIYEENYKSIFESFIENKNLNDLKKHNKDVSFKDLKNILDLPHYFLYVINNTLPDYFFNNIHLQELIELYIKKIELKDLNQMHEVFLLMILDIFSDKVCGIDCIGNECYKKALLLYSCKRNTDARVKIYYNALFFKK